MIQAMDICFSDFSSESIAPLHTTAPVSVKMKLSQWRPGDHGICSDRPYFKAK